MKKTRHTEEKIIGAIKKHKGVPKLTIYVIPGVPSTTVSTLSWK